MEFSLQKKIEVMRREPEHVRKRYVIVGVSCSMILIFGIWLLAMQDSATTAMKDTPAVMEKGKDLTGGAPSLNDLFEQTVPLRVGNKSTNGDEFFKQQQGQDTGAAPIPSPSP